MNQSQKKLIGSLGIGLAILILFVWLAALPLIGKIRQISQEYLANKETLMKLDKQELLFRNLGESHLEKQYQLLNIGGAFLSQQETVSFISTLEDIAQGTGNIFEIKTAKSFIPSEEQGGEGFLSLQVSLWGDFRSLLLFLANLEDSPYPPYRLLEIDSFSINRLSKESRERISLGLAEGDLETILGIKIYTK